MRSKHRCFAPIIAALLVITIGCTRNLKETRFTVDNPKYAILIAGDRSEFKDAVRNRIIDRYRANGDIEVVNVEDLKRADASAYDVVLIMDTCTAWSGFNLASKAFFDRVSDKANVILFMTTADPDWKYSHDGLDAITSASVTENREKMVEILSREIDMRLAGK